MVGAMNVVVRGGLAAGFLLVGFSHAMAGTNERRTAAAAVIEAVAVPANGPIVIDGNLTEEVWKQAPLISEFLQREPAEGAQPTYRTEARIAFDSEALYVGIRAIDGEPNKLVGILTRRDQRSPSDWLKIVVDSVLRPSLRLRVRGESGRREDRSLLLQRRQ